MNCIDPVLGALTRKVRDAVPEIPATLAVIVSVDAHPMSRYEAVATPATVDTPVSSCAFPTAAHPDDRLTVRGVLTGAPSLNTVTLTPVVP